MLELTVNEIYILRELTKPSGFERLYKNVKDLESINSQLNKFLEQSNYSKVTDIYTRKSIIKQSIIKNQLGLLLLYQLVRTAKVKDNKIYSLNLNASLVAILLETLTIRSLQLEKHLNKQSITHNQQMEIKIIDSIINKISNSYEIDEIYAISKKMHNELDILSFKDLVGGLK